MGIDDIFEPTKANFKPMTDEQLLYARNVEQKVTVNIRTHSMEHLKRKISLSSLLNSCFNVKMLIFLF